MSDADDLRRENLELKYLLAQSVPLRLLDEAQAEIDRLTAVLRVRELEALAELDKQDAAS